MFLRDSNAHTNEFAYKWNQNTFNRPFNRQAVNMNTKTDEIVPNLSSKSSLSSSQSTVYRDLSEDRLPKKRKGNSDAAFTKSLQHQLGTAPLHRSQTGRPKFSHSRPPSAFHPSPQSARGLQALVTQSISTAAPLTLALAPNVHSGTIPK